MDTAILQALTREAVKKKFGRKRILVSKVVPRYPDSLEREYERVVNAYMRVFHAALAERLPKLRVLLENGVRADAADDGQQPTSVNRTVAEVAAFGTSLETLFEEISQDLVERQGLFDLYGRIEKLTKLTRKLTVAEWKRVVKRTLGIDIMTDYYSGLKFRTLSDKWVADNVALTKTLPQETLGKMKELVKTGYLNGSTGKTIVKQIQEAYGVDKNHALFIARDQTAKLNAQITQEQYRDAGVSGYIWRTMDDNRVRDGHRHLNNKRFKLAEPPIVDAKTGRRCHPKEDYQCRCMALPIFGIDDVVLPWEKDPYEATWQTKKEGN
ncbi:MAG: minor capsid protein [Clostridium sp.]|jgi:SPP1 gp7 family putative phage head morphogenesis protein|nr:minor capsid protein [Clostridium sp.]